MRNDRELRWTPRETALVEKVLSELTSHAGLVILDPTRAFVLEVACTREGYGGVLLQTQHGSKYLAPVGCVSTTKKRVSHSEVVSTLQMVADNEEPADEHLHGVRIKQPRGRPKKRLLSTSGRLLSASA